MCILFTNYQIIIQRSERGVQDNTITTRSIHGNMFIVLTTQYVFNSYYKLDNSTYIYTRTYADIIAILYKRLLVVVVVVVFFLRNSKTYRTPVTVCTYLNAYFQINSSTKLENYWKRVVNTWFTELTTFS